MKKITNLILSTILCTGGATAASAQDVDSVCKPIVKSGLLETSYDILDERALANSKSFLCKQQFSTYNQAVAVDIGGSFEFMKVLKGSPDDTVDASNYSRKWKTFCESNASDISSSSYLNRTVKSLNTHIAEIYKDCVTEVSRDTGNAIAYVVPSSDRTSFTVKVVKSSGDAHIDQFSGIPQPSSCEGGLLEASADNLIEVSGSREFQCKNSDPYRVVALSGNFANDGSMFKDSNPEVPKVQNKMDLLLQRLQVVEGEIADKGTKPGMVAFFTDECPSESWAPYVHLEGRYVVGVPRAGEVGGKEGTPLTNRENRATGRHNHYYTKPRRRGANTGGSGFASYRDVGDNESAVTFSGSKDGTNAPYIQLVPCVKK